MAITDGYFDFQINDSRTMTFPIQSGETIFKGGFAMVNSSDGYLINPTTGAMGFMAVFVEDVQASTGYTATANGDISLMTNMANCAVSGELVYNNFDSIAQTDVGQIVYVRDNGTLTTNGYYGILPIGTLTKYFSSTKGAVALNWFAQPDGVYQIRGILPAGSTESSTTATILDLDNPTGAPIVIRDAFIYITTPASSAVSGDLGVTSSTGGSADTLIDGFALGTAGLYSAGGSGGTNGAPNRLVSSSQSVTLTSTNVVGSALVGVYWLEYQML